jgi:hypothetical protein
MMLEEYAIEVVVDKMLFSRNWTVFFLCRTLTDTAKIIENITHFAPETGQM